MKKKNIKIEEKNIVIGNKSIKWEDIVGIRHFNAWLLWQLCQICPYSSLFLRGGKVVRIPKEFILQGVHFSRFEDDYRSRFIEYFTTIEVINSKAKNLNPDVSAWIEWRFFCPTVMAEIILLFYGFLTYTAVAGDTLSALVKGIDLGLIGGILALPFGWIWERKARKKKWI